MTKLSFSLLVIFSNFKCFLQHNSEAASNCPFPLSIFTFTHLHSSHSLPQYAVPSFRPTQRVCTSTLHWLYFSAQLLVIAERGTLERAERVCVCVKGAGARMGKRMCFVESLVWGEGGVECPCTPPCIGIGVVGQ